MYDFAEEKHAQHVTLTAAHDEARAEAAAAPLAKEIEDMLIDTSAGQSHVTFGT